MEKKGRDWFRDAARQRLEAAKDIRRSTKKALEHQSGLSLEKKFAWCVEDYLREGGRYIPMGKISSLIDSMLLNTGVTVENIKNKHTIRETLWREHLDPMYNLLRACISESKPQRSENVVHFETFWHAVAVSLQSKLQEISKTAELKDNTLGNPEYIVTDELRK